MRIDELSYSIRNLKKRKLRSFLSVLSILIGIAAIFAIVSFGLGLQNYINEFAEASGADILFVMSKGTAAPGMDETFFMTKDDIEFIGRVKGVEDVLPFYSKVGEVKLKDEKIYSFLLGHLPYQSELIEKAFAISIERGRNLKKGDFDKIVVGHNYQIDERIFKRGMTVGDNIEINDRKFSIIGFYEEIGNPQDDSQIYMSFETMESLFPDVKDRFGFIGVKSQTNVDPNLLAEEVERKLRKYKGQEEGKEDFFVQTYADLLETYSSIIQVLNGVLALIAFVSLVVAFVNIMNTMYTSVIERTKEIGVMKAIGAKNVDIVMVFIFEAGLLGMAGGIVGVILGYLVSSAGGKIVVLAGYSFLEPVFPWYLTVGCLLFGFFTGSLAGLLPSLQAAKMEPVDALRYE